MIKLNIADNRICFITSYSDNLKDKIIMLMRSGIKWIQYREKNKTKREMFYDALQLQKIAKRFGACLIINDYADIAAAVDADGVHLGQEDLPLTEAKKILGNRIIGISTHNLEEALDAEKGGADYIGFGSIFPTTTKDNASVQGLDALKKIKKTVKIPVIAIGGIKADNIASVLKTGCDGIAVSSGLTEGDIIDNARRFINTVAFDFIDTEKL
jgi:thiamine-phosphate pyrophosphorylase